LSDLFSIRQMLAQGVVFSPDGYGRSAAAPVLASGSLDTTVRLWGVR